MPLVVVSERGEAQTRAVPRLRPLRCGGWRTRSGGPAGPPRSGRAQAKPLERGARAGESPVADGRGRAWGAHLSTAGHEQSRGKLGGPPSKATYSWRPIVNEYREGKVKSTPEGGSKDPEPVRLRAVGARCESGDGVPIEE